MSFDFALAWENLPALLAGAVTTLAITFPVMALAAAISLPMVLARLSKNRLLSGFVVVYVALFRGAPSLILLYLIYNGLAQMDAVRDGPFWFLFSSAFFCAVVGFTLNHSSYVIEILAGGLRAVPAGLVEAAQALSLTPRQVFLRVKLPLAIRYGLKAYQNEVLIFMKSTSAVSAITLVDLMAVANEVFYFTYDPFTPLLSAAAIYWAMTNILRLGFEMIDRRLNHYLHIAGLSDGARASAAAAEIPVRQNGLTRMFARLRV